MGYTLVYTQVLEFFPYLIKGAWISLQIVVLAFSGGMFFGLIFATIRTFGNKLMNNMVICYVTFFTNTPQLVQIYFLFFALPEFGILLSPFVPHICEEIWEMLGNSNSITFEPFPIFNSTMLVESTKTYPISINGKVKLKVELSLALNKEEIENIILANPEVISKLEGESQKRVIVIPGKIINLVV